MRLIWKKAYDAKKMLPAAFSYKYTQEQREPRPGRGGKLKGKRKVTTQCVFEKERLMTFSDNRNSIGFRDLRAEEAWVPFLRKSLRRWHIERLLCGVSRLMDLRWPHRIPMCPGPF